MKQSKLLGKLITAIPTCFKQDWYKVKPSWNDGWILDILKVIFWFLSWLSVGVVIPYCIEKRGKTKCRYLFVDSYVTLWIILIGLFTFLAINGTPCHVLGYLMSGLSLYRLFEIFQSWVSQYILGGVPRQWESRNIYRSLVLVFADYAQVTFSYAIIAFIFRDNFQGINCWSQSFRYSLGNAVTIGSGVVPLTCVGYTLLVTQIMFTILFLTAAVNRIIAAMKL